MTAEEIKKYLIENLGFWPIENEENTFAKNAPSLSVIYVLVKIEDENKIIITERTEKTVLGDLKLYDHVIDSFSIINANVIEKLETILASYKDWSGNAPDDHLLSLFLL